MSLIQLFDIFILLTKFIWNRAQQVCLPDKSDYLEPFTLTSFLWQVFGVTFWSLPTSIPFYPSNLINRWRSLQTFPWSQIPLDVTNASFWDLHIILESYIPTRRYPYMDMNELEVRNYVRHLRDLNVTREKKFFQPCVTLRKKSQMSQMSREITYVKFSVKITDYGCWKIPAGSNTYLVFSCTCPTPILSQWTFGPIFFA